jgi:uncharacterized protein with von Willebrand factor type A (vWA) domain
VSSGDLLAHLTRFGRALRDRGVDVTVKDEGDAAEALTLIDLLDREEVRRSLAIALKIRPRDRMAFDLLFAEFWIGRRPRTQQLGLPPTGRPRTLRAVATSTEEPRVPAAANTADGDTPGSSAEPLLRRKPFEECSERDLAAMERLLARMVRRLATSRSRRLVPTPGGRVVDIRHSLRRALGTGGELLELAHRDRAIEESRLVLLCDTSGSMDPYARFLLTFILSLRKATRRAEIFVFNTALTRLTRWIAPQKIQRTLARVAREVPDWSGGTRIGASLETFVGRYLDRFVTAKTTVVILSDGLETGDPERLARVMRMIRRRARKVIWINPLMGDSRYRPTARGMAAALPFVDHLVPGHNLEALQRLLPLMVA